MDTNDFLDKHVSTGGTGLSAENKQYLHESARWARFLGIVGFVITGLVVLGALFAGTMMASMSSMGGIGAGFLTGGMITVLYLLFALLMFFPSLYTFKFGSSMKGALANDNEAQMTEGFKNLKSMWKFWGIYMIVILGFYALMFLLSLLGGAAALLG